MAGPYERVIPASLPFASHTVRALFRSADIWHCPAALGRATVPLEWRFIQASQSGHQLPGLLLGLVQPIRRIAGQIVIGSSSCACCGPAD